MSSNILYDFLGINLDEVSELSEEAREQAVSILKLINYPEWEVFAKYLTMRKEQQKPVEYYAENPNMAHYDSGYKRALIDITTFVDNQTKILEKYGKEKEAKS